MPMTLLPYGLKGCIYRSPMPFSRYDPGGDLWREYKECEISAVVMLVGGEEAREQSGRPLRELYRKENFRVIQLEIGDYGAPELKELQAAVREVKTLAQDGLNIAVHCHAGIGRTGLFAACLAREILGLNGQEAVDWVRKFLPGAVESDMQKLQVLRYPAGGKNTT